MQEFDEVMDNEVEEGLDSELEPVDVIPTEDSVANLLKITSDKFTREKRVIKIADIGFGEPMKIGRKQTLSGLTQSVKELGVVTPVHVMAVDDESAEHG